MNTFQLVILGIFIFLAIFAVLVFSGIIPLGVGFGGSDPVELVWWGTVPSRAQGLDLSIRTFNAEHKDQISVRYVQKDSRTLEQELIGALASGRGPDLILAPHELIIRHADKLRLFSYESISQRKFIDTFAQEARLWLYPEGILALPMYIDPLVLYYNRDLFTTARLPSPPRTWEELRDQAQALTQTDERDNISQSAIALGGFNNIALAKDILVALIMQAGNPLVMQGDSEFEVTLRNTLGYAEAPAGGALAFFNKFSDSANSLYSWNSALPEARSMFTRSGLAMYLGYASELNLIRRQNPQLNFDVTTVPQSARANTADITLGRLYGLAALKSSPHATHAAQAILFLEAPDFLQSWSEVVELPPARLDLLRNKPQDPAQSVFYDSAIIARGWYDFDPQASGEIIRELAESVRQGRAQTGEALSLAHQQLTNLIPNFGQ
ncbi:MAG: extracellular solute-binding protein [Patescibacteria group bacterium]|nr:extracellular solute-binding protein [Patescibacteria group bacterium]